MKLVVFGASNMLGDIFDNALANGLTPSLVVTNTPEQVRPRTKPLAERLAALANPPRVIDLSEFAPDADECYFLGTTANARDQLVAQLEQRFTIRFANLVHPRAYVSPLATVADGVFVSAGAIVAPGASLGRFCFVNRGATIGHDTTIEAFARLMPGCNVGGHVHVGIGATIGMGANVLQEITIGSQSMVAIGAVVVRDVPPRQLAAGTPARNRPLEVDTG